MKEIDPIERVYKTFENIRMDILGEIRLVPKITLSMIPKEGNWCISFDEYNRVANDIHLELRRKRRVR